MWNILLSDIKSETIVPSKNNINPTKSGQYLCTCVHFWNNKEIKRYLQMMEYDQKTNHWSDCNSKNHISHNILAWTDDVNVCDFNDFEYIIGGYFKSTTHD